ncbi:hypothetical protein JAAARDRAFT_40017 [Jaapia argillacea MUCL 33604]|uniref:Galactokinase n=1 Tax=Jaapia argillacea MUCL 33604 TaxID=933084 RepID=A0A067PQY6_9AGAM|nr:hypothetical protein JAAARDRAFT_40017 [Jaapia argillacea MUCL 33604]
MAASLPIPIYTSLDEVYSSLGTATNHAVRWNDLAEEFENRFGRKPAFIARAPGRVNLIGEHIDYALFGVFPAAVERDILIACAPRSASSYASYTPASNEPSMEQERGRVADPEPLHLPGFVVAENLRHEKYPRKTFAPMRGMSTSKLLDEPTEEDVRAEEWMLDIDKGRLAWESYVKAGYYGVLNRFFPPTSLVTTTNPHPIPVDMLVTGTVPAGSGLSSSAAMVVASTLAFLAVNGKLQGISKGELVEMAMENEQRVGVNSGGMDQAASVISTTNSALHITFFPKLAAEPIPLPGSVSSSAASSHAVFIIANSLVVSDKVVHSKTRYNLRVVETLVSARILALRLGISVGKNEKVTLREVLGRWLGAKEVKGGQEEVDVEKLRDGLERIGEEVEKLRPEGKGDEEELGVTLGEMIQMSGLSEEEFNELYLSWVNVEATHFQLYKRSKHVFSEALRVLQFRDVCLRSATSSITTQSTLEELGALMNESQESCSKLFECSCPELDELTRLAREAGAYGSRLTGAGWGGCTVSLVAESDVDSFISKIKKAYAPYHNLEGEALHEVIFATKPSSGACVYKFE